MLTECATALVVLLRCIILNCLERNLENKVSVSLAQGIFYCFKLADQTDPLNLESKLFATKIN
jgi:hypothetical protein